MSEPKPVTTNSADATAADTRRREALVRIGRYTAYATPVVLASMSVPARPAAAAPISGSPPPPPPAPPSVT